eukprot:10998280-Prorocentrum_lima.AAC.1
MSTYPIDLGRGSGSSQQWGVSGGEQPSPRSRLGRRSGSASRSRGNGSKKKKESDDDESSSPEPRPTLPQFGHAACTASVGTPGSKE